MIKGNIIGKRTNSFTGHVKDVQLTYVIELSQSKHIKEDFALRLMGGPTGYESFTIDDDMSNLKRMAEKGWTACMGTKGKWDKLEIEAKEMKGVLEAFSSSDKICPHCNYVNMMHDKICHECNKDMSEKPEEEECLGPLNCKKDGMYVVECCQMNGGFHTKPIEKPKGPFVFEHDDGVTLIPERK